MKKILIGLSIAAAGVITALLYKKTNHKLDDMFSYKYNKWDKYYE